MAKKINILVVEPGKAPRPARVKNTLPTFSEIVGGSIEMGCYLPQACRRTGRIPARRIISPERLCCAALRATALSR